jgi:hypothetical protein
LADVIDERLNAVSDRHRNAGRTTGLALRVAAAIQAMTNALTELKEHWCQATTGQTPTGQAVAGQTVTGQNTTGQNTTGQAITWQSAAGPGTTGPGTAGPGTAGPGTAGPGTAGTTIGARGPQSRLGDQSRLRGQSPHGHHGYRPPAAMRRLIERTHPICAFPTCDRPAPGCDLDHTTPWHQGGPTCPCNMSPLCRRHHRLKQHPQWHLFQPWPGLGGTV